MLALPRLALASGSSGAASAAAVLAALTGAAGVGGQAASAPADLAPTVWRSRAPAFRGGGASGRAGRHRPARSGGAGDGEPWRDIVRHRPVLTPPGSSPGHRRLGPAAPRLCVPGAWAAPGANRGRVSPILGLTLRRRRRRGPASPPLPDRDGNGNRRRLGLLPLRRPRRRRPARRSRHGARAHRGNPGGGDWVPCRFLWAVRGPV